MPDHAPTVLVADEAGAVPAEPHRHTPDADARGYWYRIGHGHTHMIKAANESEARAAVLARHPHARGQRIELTPWS